MTERLLRLLASLLGLGRPRTRLRTRVAFAGQTLEMRAMLSGTPAEIGPADAGGDSDPDTTNPDTTDPNCDCPCDETHQPQTDEELPADDESPDEPAADGDPTADDPNVPPEDEDCDCPCDPEDPAGDGTGDDTTGDDTTGGGTGGGGSGGSDSGTGDDADPDGPTGDDGGGTDDGGADDGSGGEDPSGDGPEDDTGDDGTSDDGASDDGTSGDDGGTTGGSGDDSSGNGTGDTGGDDSGSGGPGGSDGDSNPPGDGGADDSGDGGTSDDGVGDTGTGDGGNDTGGNDTGGGGSDGTGSDGGTGDDGSGGGDSGDTGSDGDTPNGPGDGGPSGDGPSGDDPTGDDPTGDDGNPDDPDDPDDDGPDMPDEPGGPDTPDEPGGPDTDPGDPDGPTDDPGDPGSPEDPGVPDDDPSDGSGNLAPYFDDRVWRFTAGETVFGDGGPALLTGEDPEGQQITFSGGGDTPFRVAANGSVDYADDASTTETEYTFTAEVRDPLGAIGYATVIVTIYQEPDPTNTPPEFEEPAYQFEVEQGFAGPVGNVFATDADGDPLTYSGAFSGLAVAGDGSVTVNTEATDAPGTYTLTATVEDGRGGVDTATVTLVVGQDQQANGKPQFVKDTFEVGFGYSQTELGKPARAGIVIDPGLAAIDPEGNDLTFRFADPPEGEPSPSAYFTIDPENGKLGVTDADGLNAAVADSHRYSFTVEVSDGTATDSAEVVLYESFEAYEKAFRETVTKWKDETIRATERYATKASLAANYYWDIMEDKLEETVFDSPGGVATTIVSSVLSAALSEKAGDVAGSIMDNVAGIVFNAMGQVETGGGQSFADLRLDALEKIEDDKEAAIDEIERIAVKVLSDFFADNPTPGASDYEKWANHIEALKEAIRKFSETHGVPKLPADTRARRQAGYMLLEYGKEHVHFGGRVIGHPDFLRDRGQWWDTETGAPGQQSTKPIQLWEFVDMLNALGPEFHVIKTEVE